MSYTPTDADLAWTLTTLSVIRDGGVWVVPQNQNVYAINKRELIVTMVLGDKDELHEKIVANLTALGWSMQYVESLN